MLLMKNENKKNQNINDFKIVGKEYGVFRGCLK